MEIKNILKEIDQNIILDLEQQQVVIDNSKNLIVIAGAGSGKTTTIMAKVKYLVKYKHINPNEILIISFTNKTIDDLKDNINNKLGIDAHIYTFHKLAYELLKENDMRYKINNDSNKLLEHLIKKNSNTKTIQKHLKKDKIYKKIIKNSLNENKVFIDFTVNNIRTLQINSNNKPVIKNKYIEKYYEYINNILSEYNEIIKDSYELDFESLITKASKIDSIKNRYKYIIVDEYQDISKNRYILLQKLIKITNAYTIVVGDDFQAIYAFAGSNINLFLNYENDMNAKKLFISRTYRNSQELINITGNFIMSSDKQIKKQLVSSKRLDNPLEIYGYTNNFTFQFEKIINEISKTSNEILVLGRYKDDILKIKSNMFNIKDNNIIYKKNKNIIIKFMTIHSAKGLGFENVILINFENDIKGFPSKIKETNIRRELFNMKTDILEERRLFYVALTRTKNKVYILTKIKKESIFMKDIFKYNNVKINYKYKP
ncbi:MAG TPA: UvrD-helicase domain-containing protein [Bacilli bacterium]|nr:UvrD-helicase domain-containing protein [Bacilli bacterium]